VSSQGNSGLIFYAGYNFRTSPHNWTATLFWNGGD
jgi:hypothetical protein